MGSCSGNCVSGTMRSTSQPNTSMSETVGKKLTTSSSSCEKSSYIARKRSQHNGNGMWLMAVRCHRLLLAAQHGNFAHIGQDINPSRKGPIECSSWGHNILLLSLLEDSLRPGFTLRAAVAISLPWTPISRGRSVAVGKTGSGGGTTCTCGRSDPTRLVSTRPFVFGSYCLVI